MASDLERRIAALSPAKRAIFERSRAAAPGPRAVPELRAVAPHDERTIAMRAGGSEPPFFFLHGDLTGAGFYCRDLLAALDDEQPLYVFVPHGIEGDALPYTIEEIAGDLLRTVRRIAPHGPYRLGGFCSGGLVAFEIARRLRAAGERVEALVLLDTSGRNASFAAFQDAAARLARLLRLSDRAAPALTGYLSSRSYALRALLRSGWSARRAVAAEKLRSLARRAGAALRPRRGRGAGNEDAVPPSVVELEERWRLVRYRYTPRRYDGPLTLLLAERRIDTADHATLTARWRIAAPRVETRVVPGDHLTCIAEHVGGTVAIVAECLRNARRT